MLDVAFISNNMQNYETLIMERLQGSTPKQKYESLLRLEQENLDYIVKLNCAKTFFEGLIQTVDNAPETSVKGINSFIQASYKTIL